MGVRSPIVRDLTPNFSKGLSMIRRALMVVSGALAVSIVGIVPTVGAAPLPVLPLPAFPFLATPAPPAPQTATIDHVTMLTDRRAAMFVFSPAMQRVIQVQVMLPADQSAARPTLYMLDGVSAGSESGYTESTWTQKTDAVAFFADKNTNVVMPIGGTGSYYADWQKPDPVLGLNKWDTFLSKELPPLVDSQFKGNGTNAILGLSMGAQAAMNLITKYPSLYTGVAGFSGCYDNSAIANKNAVRATVGSVSGNATNMWGENSDPDWEINDPAAHVEALRGKEVFIATGNGLPGPHEFEPGANPVVQFFAGAPLEAGANVCTRSFEQTLGAAGIPATFAYRPYGTHSWGYWEDDMHDSWPTMKRALGL